DLSQQFARGAIVRIGEYEMFERRGGPAIFAIGDIFSQTDQRRVLAPNILDVFPRRFHWWQSIQTGRVSVVPAHIALVDCPHIVPQGAVIAPAAPITLQRLGELQGVRNLLANITLVHQIDRAVVNEPVEISLQLEVSENGVIAPFRPMVTLEPD